MAWEWSHSQDAYDDARRNMESLDRATREVIAAEWMGTSAEEIFRYKTILDEKLYRRGLRRAKRWSEEKLNEMIWGKMESFATCTNGGHEAYCCPHGCGCHLVSFSAPKQEYDDDEFMKWAHIE